MARRSLRRTAEELTATDSPFAGVIGAGRKAAHRRRILRRVVAGLLALCALGVLLLRPGAGGGGATTAAPTTTAPADAGSGFSIPGVGGLIGGNDEATTDAASPVARGGPGDTAGAEAVPAGLVGVSLPVNAVLGRRLDAGDSVDVYAPGRGEAIAYGATVIDVTRPEDAPAGDGGMSAAGSGIPATAFLAVTEAEVSRISAGQKGQNGIANYVLVVLPRHPDQASGRDS